MSPLLAFRGSWARIERAHAHYKALGKLWEDFASEDPYSVALNVEDDGTGDIRVVPRYSELPDQFSFLLGETLYQLRAALDSAVYGAAVQQTGKNPPPDEQYLEFPICIDEPRFKQAAWKIRPLSDEHKAFIESVQPYKAILAPRPNMRNIPRTLGILNDWARIDRHRKLHVLGSWASKNSPGLALPDGCRLVEFTIQQDSFLERQEVVATFRLSGFVRGMKLKANPDLAIDIAVDEAPRPCTDDDTLGERVALMITAAKFVVGNLEELSSR